MEPTAAPSHGIATNPVCLSITCAQVLKEDTWLSRVCFMGTCAPFSSSESDTEDSDSSSHKSDSSYDHTDDSDGT